MRWGRESIDGNGDFFLDDVVLRRFRGKAKLAVILGSGLGGVVRRTSIVDEISYEDIASLGKPGVRGHRGRMVLAELETGKVLLFDGRRPTII